MAGGGIVKIDDHIVRDDLADRHGGPAPVSPWAAGGHSSCRPLSVLTLRDFAGPNDLVNPGGTGVGSAVRRRYPGTTTTAGRSAARSSTGSTSGRTRVASRPRPPPARPRAVWSTARACGP